MSIKNNIKKFYGFSFLRESMFIIPVIVLFWQENGLSLFQIMVLQALFALSVVFWEVPTGIVADKVGRKQSLMAGAFVMFIATMIYGFGTNFWQFFWAEFVWAMGTSFVSGANSAFIFDSLKQEKREEKFKKVWGNIKSYGYLAAGISAIIGGFVAVYSLRANWFLAAGGIFLMFVVSLFFVEPKHYEKVEKKSYWKHTKESFIEAFRNKPLLFLVLFHALLGIVARIILWFYQPYMSQSGLPIFYFGIVWASFNIFAILGSQTADKVESVLGQRWSLWLIILAMTLTPLLMGMYFAIFGLIFIAIQQYIRGYAPPVIGDYTNKLLSQDKRATLLSIQNLAASLGFAIVGPLFGYFADVFSLSSALMITGVSFLVAFGLLMIWGRSLGK